MRVVRTLLHLSVAAAVSAAGFHATARPLPASVRSQIVSSREWHAGCPVALSQLRLVTLGYYGFDGRPHTGQLVVSKDAVAPLRQVFRRLYSLRFPIRSMRLADTYVAKSAQNDDGTASFECRDASSSPCGGSSDTGTGSWSEHAYGEAVDLNPVENPYVGCGTTRDKNSVAYLDRSRHRTGMVTAAVVAAFRAVGWGWGGSWSGSTKDYMHFSATGH